MGKIPKSACEKSFFFSAQRISLENLKSTKAVKFLKTGINILTRRVWVGKILHKILLKISCRRSTIPKAWELKNIDYLLGNENLSTFGRKKKDMEKRFLSKLVENSPNPLTIRLSAPNVYEKISPRKNARGTVNSFLNFFN